MMRKIRILKFRLKRKSLKVVFVVKKSKDYRADMLRELTDLQLKNSILKQKIIAHDLIAEAKSKKIFGDEIKWED
jgi:hypothetical protein